MSSKYYRPPKRLREVVNVEKTREKSNRIQAKVEKAQEEKKTKKVAAQKRLLVGAAKKAPKEKWTVNERQKLLNALKEHGSRDIDALATKVTSKTPVQVKEMVKRNKRQVHLVEEVEEQPSSASNCGRPQRDSAPIESWIGLSSIKRTYVDSSMECSHILPDMLDLIGSHEKHPEEGDIDYAAIYKALASLMHGDVPPDLNEATSLKLTQLFAMLQTKVRETCVAIRDETALLERYSWRDVETLNANLVASSGKVDDAQMQIMCHMNGVNPLKLHPAMFVKPLFKKPL